MRASAVVLVVLLLAGCTAQEPAPAVRREDGGGNSTADRSTGPAWSFTSTEGQPISRDSPNRSATVIFFMASWCATCKSKTGVLAGVHRDYEPRGLATFSVSFDTADSDESLREWARKYDQPWPHGRDPGFAIQRTFGVTSQSSVVVLDGGGEVVQKWGYGAVTDAALRAAVERAI